MRNDFACFILCHGRPDNTPTYKNLRKYNYTGKIYIICDDEDNTIDGYKENYGSENVMVFNKDETLMDFDIMDTKGDKRCAVFARNACYKIASELGLKYFVQLDDDYDSFRIRYVNEDAELRSIQDVSLDEIFDMYIDFMNSSELIYSVAFAQGGDYIGGAGNPLVVHGYRRKCMNSWICKTDRPLQFNGTMNDDVNTYTLYGFLGKLFFTFPNVMINQPETQQVKGGMTELYCDNGTYQKSFYTVMQCPSFVKVNMMGDHYYRMHHHVMWENACPKIISERFKKYE